MQDEALLGSTCEAKFLLAAFARVVQVVQCEDDPGSLQAIIVVLVPVQHGQGRRLPFMDVQDVWLRA